VKKKVIVGKRIVEKLIRSLIAQQKEDIEMSDFT
jgi:hypothetical protein